MAWMYGQVGLIKKKRRYNIHLEKCINHRYIAWWILTKWMLPHNKHLGQATTSPTGRANLKQSENLGEEAGGRGRQDLTVLGWGAGRGGRDVSTDMAWLLPLWSRSGHVSTSSATWLALCKVSVKLLCLSCLFRRENFLTKWLCHCIHHTRFWRSGLKSLFES